MGGFFRKDGLVTLAALILGKTPLAVLDDTRIVHGDECIFAFRAVETLLREPFVFLCQDGSPEQVLVMLRRLHARMGVLFHRPPVFLQTLDGKLVVGLLVVGTACIPVTVTVIMQVFVDMVTVVVAELVHQRVHHGVILFITLDEELVDVVVHRLTCQHLRHEVIVALLRHFQE